MRLFRLAMFLSLVLSCAAVANDKKDGNRFAYLDELDPYYVSRTFPKLTTAQWVGEPGVEAVVVLAIDDMRDSAKYKAYLRPILDRLKQIDGRAAVSIMTNSLDPADPRLQGWLKEGVSLETHTLAHPCPILAGGDFAKAKGTYDACVDLLATVPGSKPVAFRTPCCDSKNTPSPRLWAEVFNKTTPKGNFLTIDSSVFNIITPNDPELPRELVFDEQGRDWFRKYVPFQSFVNTIEDYPYPYVIGGLCWQFPCVTPSDWQAQYVQKPNNPQTVRDWQAALDATVIKGGTFNLVFHPHNWIKPQQVVELIDYAVAKHGKKVKFLTFRECQERLDKHLLAGQPLRAKNGQDNGVRLLDLNGDGYLDVLIGNDEARQTRVWQPRTVSWAIGEFPVSLVEVDDRGNRHDAGVRFGTKNGKHPFLLLRSERAFGAYRFDGEKWNPSAMLLNGLEVGGQKIFTRRGGRDGGVRLRDLDGDGRSELVAGGASNAVFAWERSEKQSWQQLPFALPQGAAVVDAEGRDGGLRFVDVDEDGRLDVLFSDGKQYGLYLFESMGTGWSRKVKAGKAGEPGALPPIVRNGTNNGAWFHSRHLWVQNEDTDKLPDLVDRRSFNDLLADVEPGPRSAEASLRSMRARPGFTVELVAAEPLVMDPVAFAWGPDAKLWVVEMGDYPLGVDGKGKFGGVVRFLEDLDGDGKYDKSTVFLENLGYPTGVFPWRKGAIVVCPPEVLYAEDTDGDGKADKREPLFTGFSEGNQQHRANGLTFGLDNWLYGANGHSHGNVTSVKTGKKTNISGRDFRLRPDDGAFESAVGVTQYVRSRDDWGNWFGNDNSNPMWQWALEEHYLKRNPHFAPPSPRLQVQEQPGASRVYPISRTIPRYNDYDRANRFTSANSTIIYCDELLGKAFAGNMFVSEPVHNLVHREVVTPKGLGFTARRSDGERQSEFLASSDNWFRPTMLQTGPDGALWVADMYRHVIEHPEWIPKETQRRLDLRAGHDKGRIYRVYPVGVNLRPIPRLDKLDTAGLVAALDSPNGWQRDTAQQLLTWRADAGAAEPLRKLARENRNPLARLHALCTLDGLGALTAGVLKGALKDEHPGVRRHAVRLSESLLADAPELGGQILPLAGDPDPHVRQQVAYTLGAWRHTDAGRALAGLLARSAGEPYIGAAALSSINKTNLGPVLRAVLKGPQEGGPRSPELLSQLFRMASAMGDTRSTAAAIEALAAPAGADGRHAAWQFEGLAALLSGLESSNNSLAALAEGGEETAAAVKRLDALFDAARAVAADPEADPSRRLPAVRLLGRRGEDMKLLAGLLTPQTPHAVQAAAVETMARTKDPQIPALLLARWKSYSPRLREAVLEALLARPQWTAAVVEAIEKGRIATGDFDAARRQRLLTDKSDAIRSRAEKLFEDAVNPDRQKVIEAFSPAASLQGDAKRGAELFNKTCAVCHAFAGTGNPVGPDLAALTDKSSESLLVSILDPNRAVESKYTAYIADTADGQTYTGVLIEEGGNSVTLLQADGKPKQILRTELTALRSGGVSLMPENLEAGLKPQDLADLMAHLRSVGKPRERRVVEGNKPEVVLPGEQGVLRLTPATCEIYGTNIMLEKQYGNLGWWRGEDDHAVWTVQPGRAGKYEVWLEWACEDKTAGNTWQLLTGGSRVTGKVQGTGTWDNYQRAKVGDVQLHAGRQRVTFRSVGDVAGAALIDLKLIELVPVGAGS